MSSRRRTYSLLEVMTMGEVLYSGVLDVPVTSSGTYYTITASLTRKYDLSKELLFIIGNRHHETDYGVPGLLCIDGYYNNKIMIYGKNINSNTTHIYAEKTSTTTINFKCYNFSIITKIPVLILAIPRTDI